MNNEEKKAINNLKEIIELVEEELKNNNKNTNAVLDIIDLKSLDTVLNLVNKQLSEIKEKDIKNREFEQKIIKVLENVGYTRGVLTYENDKNVYILGEQMDNYLACITLAELIKTGALELNFKEEKNERKMKYLKKLLKEG